MVANLDSSSVNSLSSGALHELLTLQAENAIEAGSRGGLIHSLDSNPTGRRDNGLMPQERGLHEADDIAVVESLQNNKMLAEDRRDSEAPRKLFIVAEVGQRGVDHLSRLCVAAACVAADIKRSKVQAFFVAGGHEMFDASDVDGAQTDDNLPVLLAYDEFVDQVRKGSAPSSAKVSANALSDVLRYIDPEDAETHSIRKDNDVSFVFSAFTAGALRQKDKGDKSTPKLTGFTWEDPLSRIHDRLDDRLYVARLTSPGQLHLPNARVLQHNGRRLHFDKGELQAKDVRYNRLGVEKARYIKRLLKDFRVLNLDTTAKSPLNSVVDFVFGKPPGDDDQV